MTATKLRTLLLIALCSGGVGYLLTALIYFELPPLPALAPSGLTVLALLELIGAKAIHDWVTGTGRGGRLNALQVARAVLLAKASSLSGSVLVGIYAGVFAWTFARKDIYASAGHDALLSGLSALASLLLVVAALVLERSCRTPRLQE